MNTLKYGNRRLCEKISGVKFKTCKAYNHSGRKIADCIDGRNRKWVIDYGSGYVEEKMFGVSYRAKKIKGWISIAKMRFGLRFRLIKSWAKRNIFRCIPSESDYRRMTDEEFMRHHDSVLRGGK